MRIRTMGFDEAVFTYKDTAFRVLVRSAGESSLCVTVRARIWVDSALSGGSGRRRFNPQRVFCLCRHCASGTKSTRRFVRI